MVQIIRLHGDPHSQTQTLLPWYVNGTLDPAELATVDAHLVECAECRADLELERGLKDQVANMPIDIERGWSAMRSRLEQGTMSDAGRVVPLRSRSWLRRPIPVGWAFAAQAAVVLLLIGGFSLQGPRAGIGQSYHTLGAPADGTPGNMIVIFRPDTVEQDLRTAVTGNGARLVGGPTSSNAYILAVADTRRSAALSRLRADPHVVLAEPIDAGGRP